MPQPKPDEIRLSMDVPKDLWARVDALARREGRIKRYIVAEALREYLAKREGK
jgi:predicted transcriptional regulator